MLHGKMLFFLIIGTSVFPNGSSTGLVYARTFDPPPFVDSAERGIDSVNLHLSRYPEQPVMNSPDVTYGSVTKIHHNTYHNENIRGKVIYASNTQQSGNYNYYENPNNQQPKGTLGDVIGGSNIQSNNNRFVNNDAGAKTRSLMDTQQSGNYYYYEGQNDQQPGRTLGDIIFGSNTQSNNNKITNHGAAANTHYSINTYQNGNYSHYEDPKNKKNGRTSGDVIFGSETQSNYNVITNNGAGAQTSNSIDIQQNGNYHYQPSSDYKIRGF